MPQVLAGQAAVPPEEGGFTKPLGLPPRLKWSLGLTAGAPVGHVRGNALFLAQLGLYKNIISTDMEALGVLFEGYVGATGARTDAGGRALLSSPFFCLGLGMDWDVHRNAPDILARIWLPIHRGGWAVRGGMLFLDYIPGRSHTLRLGLNIPLWPGEAGRTRPRLDHVILENRPVKPAAVSPDPPELKASLAALHEHGVWINRLALPYLDKPGPDNGPGVMQELAAIKARLAAQTGPFAGRGVDYETRAFHDALERALDAAAGPSAPGPGPSAGSRAAKVARDALLAEVLIPYNRLLGQAKRKDTTNPFAAQAADVFARWLVAESGIPHERFPALMHVFDQLLDVVEEARAFSAPRWADSKFMWLPLEYALLPEDHDTQAEIDGLLGRLAAAPLTEGNDLSYLLNDDFQTELVSTVNEARDYHILWVHDIAGRNPAGSPDRVACDLIVKGYLKALADRAEEYDRTGKIPTYLIFFDQHYFETNNGRGWMELLSSPLTFDPPDSLPAAMKAAIGLAQDRLRRVVDGSILLREQRRQHGEGWLNNFISVKAYITNPADPSFRSAEILPIIGVPDEIMRDHRKLVLFDVSEADPYAGRAIYTGMGVGELYANAYWEDRGLVVRGPDNLRLKRAAVELLASQGIAGEAVPYALRPLPLAPNYADLVKTHIDAVLAGGDRPARLLNVQNRTGFGQKDINPVKAGLYNLLPGDTVIAAPDSLWQNYVYAGLLVGASLRGVHAWIMAPALASAPTPQPGAMVRTRGMLSRLLIVRRVLGPEISRGGGDLRVGIYDPKSGVGDIPARFLAMSRTFDTVPFLKDIYKFYPSAAELVNDVAALLGGQTFRSKYEASAGARTQAKLHLKANLVISRAAFRILMGLPEWADYLRPYLFERARTVTGLSGALNAPLPSMEMEAVGRLLMRRFVEAVPPEEAQRMISYFLIGSANMDYRSMLMDGEAMVLVSGVQALSPLLDLAEIEGLSRWIETPADVDKLIPPPKSPLRWLCRWEKRAL